jgi:TRAP-type mannitol/chloroaromatic compound transport system permease small subunit
MERLLRISDAIGHAVAALGKAGAWLLLPLTFVMMFDVFARKFRPLQMLVNDTWLKDYLSSTKLQELEWHLHGVVLLLGFGFAYVCDKHVRIDGWRDKRTPKTQALVEIVGICVAMLPFCSLLLYEAVHFVQMSYVSNEGSAAMTGLPHRWIIKSFLIVGYVLLILSGLAMLMRAVYFYLHPLPGKPPLRIVELEEPPLPGGPPPQGASIVSQA